MHGKAADTHSDPPTFLGWRETEMAVEAQSLEFLGKHLASQDFSVVITSAAQIIFRHAARHPDDQPCNHSEDEHTVLYLGARIFNASQASWCLLLRGYYGPALTVQREVIESTLLLQRFSIEPVEIARWRKSNLNERLKRYKPSRNKRTLDAAGQPNLYFRFGDYCEVAAHPTPQGRGLTTVNGRFSTGPHFNAELFKRLLEQFALNVGFACDLLCGFSFLGNPDREARRKMRALFDGGSFSQQETCQ